MPSMTAAFDIAFGPHDIRVIRGNHLDGSVDLGINGEVYTVSQVRCEICDEWGPCVEHLDMARSAVMAFKNELPLPFDRDSEEKYREWQLLYDSLGTGDDL